MGEVRRLRLDGTTSPPLRFIMKAQTKCERCIRIITIDIPEAQGRHKLNCPICAAGFEVHVSQQQEPLNSAPLPILHDAHR